MTGWDPKIRVRASASGRAAIASGPLEATPGIVILFTGLPAAGKTTLAEDLVTRAHAVGYRASRLDGDTFRAAFCPDLGYSIEDRHTNLRRAALMAAEMARLGAIVTCSFVAPHESSRMEMRAIVTAAGGAFLLVHVSTPLAECERRDTKGLYRRARSGALDQFTGISDGYQTPIKTDFTIDTTDLAPALGLDPLYRYLAANGWPALWPHRGNEQSPRTQLYRRTLAALTGPRVTLAELSQRLQVERHAIESAVRLSAGVEFRVLRDRLLIERAEALLATAIPIKQVAFDLGFGSTRAFDRFILRIRHTTPLGIRRSAKMSIEPPTDVPFPVDSARPRR